MLPSGGNSCPCSLLSTALCLVHVLIGLSDLDIFICKGNKQDSCVAGSVLKNGLTQWFNSNSSAKYSLVSLNNGDSRHALLGHLITVNVIEHTCGLVHSTPRLDGLTAPGLQTCTAHYCTKQHEIKSKHERKCDQEKW